MTLLQTQFLLTALSGEDFHMLMLLSVSFDHINKLTVCHMKSEYQMLSVIMAIIKIFLECVWKGAEKKKLVTRAGVVIMTLRS